MRPPELTATFLWGSRILRMERFFKPAWLTTSLLLFISFAEIESAPLREHRDLMSFSMMVAYKTGRSAFEFNNYGRYCGLYGSGPTVDETDKCCSAHDKCYMKATGYQQSANSTQWSPCKPWGDYSPYWIRYMWASDANNTVTCVHDDIRFNKYADCAFEVCECDNAVTSCFAHSGYNPSNQKTLMWRVVEQELATTFFNVTYQAVEN